MESVSRLTYAPQLQHHFIRGGNRQRVHRTVGTGGDDPRLGADDRELDRRAVLPLAVKGTGKLIIGQP